MRRKLIKDDFRHVKERIVSARVRRSDNIVDIKVPSTIPKLRRCGEG